MITNRFKLFWKTKLTARELRGIRSEIKTFRDEGRPYGSKVDAVMDMKPKKLDEEWKAERVVRTEDKRLETREVKAEAKELGYEKFIILPSYNACEDCIAFSDNGKRIFTKEELLDGHGRNRPPVHVQCQCMLSPYIER